MKRVQAMVQLSDELIAQLDAEAARRGESRSAVLRDAVTAYFASAREEARLRAIVEGYTRSPQTIPDAWGDLDRESEVAAREVAQRMEEEEARAGKRW